MKKMGNGYLNSNFVSKSVLKCPFSTLWIKLEKLLGEQKNGAKLVSSACIYNVDKQSRIRHPLFFLFKHIFL